MPGIPDKYKLMPFQEEGVEYICGRKYALLADSMGLGKTLQALSAAVRLKAEKILIICPSNLVLQWVSVIKEFFPEYNMSTLDSKKPFLGQKWVLISSYYFTSSNPYLKDLNFDFVVIDESHALKDPTRKRTKKILGKGSFLKNAARVLLMTGTPVMNRPAELYIMLKTFCPELLGRHIAWPFFVRRYCGFAAKGATNTDELALILKEFMLRRTLDDPEIQRQLITYLPPVVTQKIYIEGIKNPENEYLTTGRRLISEEKIPYIAEYCDDILQSVEKILLVCYHRETIKQLEEKLKSYNPVTIIGGQDHTSRQVKLGIFKESPECKILIGQINTIGFGVDGLQHVCNRIVMAELDWSPGVIDQTIARLQRYGQNKTVYVDFLIAKGTIEEQIDKKLKWKRKVIAELTEQEGETKLAKAPKIAGLDEAFNVIAQYIADKVLAGLKTPLAMEVPQEILNVSSPTTGNTTILKELTPDDGLELVGGPSSEPEKVEEPKITFEMVSDKVYTLLDALEEGGVPKNTAMDYYKNQVINGLSANNLKGLKETELPGVLDKLERIDLTTLIKNLKPAPADDGI